MSENPSLSSRKAEHIQINLENDVASSLSTGLERFLLVHNALPELDLGEIEPGQVIFNKWVAAPILISSMTGGTPEAARVNLALAEAAEEAGVAMGLGSQRAAIEDASLEYTFQVRKKAPHILLFANLGAVQLNYSYGLDQCQKAVDMIEADALILHLNPLQEALQPEGDTSFKGLMGKIENVCHSLAVPVVVKEVGWGISEDIARKLRDVGVAAIDVAGAGGTSWSQVEMYRNRDENLARVAAAFRGWGIPTAESIRQVRIGAPGLPIFASGGLKNGVDIAKCIALGAIMGGMAAYFLRAGSKSFEAARQAILEIRQEILVCMFATGSANIGQMQSAKIIEQ
jgi:isopentenyl-diphosphate Delta-isomerase